MRKSLTRLLTAGMIVASPLYSVFADTIYYGNDIKGKSNPAYVEFNKIAEHSKYTKEIPAQNDPKYNRVVTDRDASVYAAIFGTAMNKGYDLVVEKNDPVINNAKDITSEVIAQLNYYEKD
ncbi:MAG TPA: hypothetical protein P5277_01430 [Candidatus Paceibacterota bacterium]|nr:hypothetical protein [Candidatus Paceibacterota bacterium]